MDGAVMLVAAQPEHAAPLKALRMGVLGAPLAGLPASVREPLVAMQLAAQDADYSRQYPHALELAILCGHELVGRWLLDESGSTLELLDLAILANLRNAGLGTAALEAALARAPNLPARLAVQHGNPAERLYRRLGFLPCADLGTHLQLERPALLHPAARQGPGGST